jgi:hypothetical protein
VETINEGARKRFSAGVKAPTEEGTGYLRSVDLLGRCLLRFLIDHSLRKLA